MRTLIQIPHRATKNILMLRAMHAEPQMIMLFQDWKTCDQAKKRWPTLAARFFVSEEWDNAQLLFRLLYQKTTAEPPQNT